MSPIDTISGPDQKEAEDFVMKKNNTKSKELHEIEKDREPLNKFAGFIEKVSNLKRGAEILLMKVFGRKDALNKIYLDLYQKNPHKTKEELQETAEQEYHRLYIKQSAEQIEKPLANKKNKEKNMAEKLEDQLGILEEDDEKLANMSIQGLKNLRLDLTKWNTNIQESMDSKDFPEKEKNIGIETQEKIAKYLERLDKLDERYYRDTYLDIFRNKNDKKLFKELERGYNVLASKAAFKYFETEFNTVKEFDKKAATKTPEIEQQLVKIANNLTEGETPSSKTEKNELKIEEILSDEDIEYWAKALEQPESENKLPLPKDEVQVLLDYLSSQNREQAQEENQLVELTGAEKSKWESYKDKLEKINELSSDIYQSLESKYNDEEDWTNPTFMAKEDREQYELYKRCQDLYYKKVMDLSPSDQLVENIDQLSPNVIKEIIGNRSLTVEIDYLNTKLKKQSEEEITRTSDSLKEKDKTNVGTETLTEAETKTWKEYCAKLEEIYNFHSDTNRKLQNEYRNNWLNPTYDQDKRDLQLSTEANELYFEKVMADRGVISTENDDFSPDLLKPEGVKEILSNDKLLEEINNIYIRVLDAKNGKRPETDEMSKKQEESSSELESESGEKQEVPIDEEYYEKAKALDERMHENAKKQRKNIFGSIEYNKLSSEIAIIIELLDSLPGSFMLDPKAKGVRKEYLREKGNKEKFDKVYDAVFSKKNDGEQKTEEPKKEQSRYSEYTEKFKKLRDVYFEFATAENPAEKKIAADIAVLLFTSPEGFSRPEYADRDKEMFKKDLRETINFANKIDGLYEKYVSEEKLAA